jgi:hypothetical protein
MYLKQTQARIVWKYDVKDEVLPQPDTAYVHLCWEWCDKAEYSC